MDEGGDMTGSPVTHVSSGGKSLGREAITAGHEDVPVRFYRTNAPTIFCGFQINWVDGSDEDTGTEFSINAGAGFGSKYMTLQVQVPGRETVYEYVDITEVLSARVLAIIGELVPNDPR